MIETTRLRLEPIEPAHADCLFEGLHDERLYEFIAAAPPASIDVLRTRFEKLAGRRSPDGTQTWLNWAIWVCREARYVGHVQATIENAGQDTGQNTGQENRSAEIAYVLFRDAWGNGYARESVTAMLTHLRDHFGVATFRANVDPRNHRSIALLNALEFERVGCRTAAEAIRGMPADEWQYVL